MQKEEVEFNYMINRPASGKSEQTVCDDNELGAPARGLALNHYYEDPYPTTLKSYLIATNDNHKRDINITCKEISGDIVPTLISYAIGTLSAIPYFGMAKKAADLDPGTLDSNYILYPAGAFTLNALLNSFFVNEIVAEHWHALFSNKPSEVRDALENLKNYQPGTLNRFCRWSKEAATFIIFLSISGAAGVPNYVLSQRAGDSKMMSALAGGAAAAMVYKGVKAIALKVLPQVYRPIKWLHHKCDSEAMEQDHKEYISSELKRAHSSVLTAALDVLLIHIRDNPENHPLEEYPELTILREKIFKLIKKDNPTLEQSCELLLALLQLPPQDQFQPSPSKRTAFQILNLGLAITSLIGLGISTIEDVNKIDMPSFVKIIADVVIIGAYSGLNMDIAWEVGGNIYNLCAYAFNKMGEIISPFPDFGAVLSNLKRDWRQILQPSLSIIQNPKAMLYPLVLIYGLSYFSTQGSTYLNRAMLEAYLGTDNKTLDNLIKVINIMTTVSVMLFNSYPANLVLSKMQRYYTRIFSNNRERYQIKLQDFIQKQTEIVNDMDDEQFLKIFHEITNIIHLNSTDIQQLTVDALLGGKLVEILRDHPQYENEEHYKIFNNLCSHKQEEPKKSSSWFGNWGGFWRQSKPTPSLDERTPVFPSNSF